MVIIPRERERRNTMNQCRFLTSEGYKGVSVIATILGGVHYYENYFGMQVVLSSHGHTC